jgi:hypothetical protein
VPWRELKRLAELYEKGGYKYGDHNWEKGQPPDRFFDSAIRHLVQWREGEDTEDHLAAALFNILGIMYTLTEIELGNLPSELLGEE